jgi:UDP-perosamine 4-acetyltransferase
VVEHDGVVGAIAHVAPGAILCGNVSVGARALVGAGAVVIPGRAIGADAVVGAGAVVVRDVPAGITVRGVPAHA